MQEVKISALTLKGLDRLRDHHREYYGRTGRRKRFNRMVTRAWMLEQLVCEALWRWENPEHTNEKGKE